MSCTCAQRRARRDREPIIGAATIETVSSSAAYNAPTAYLGRPVTPAPGASSEELRVATVRSHGRRLILPVVVLIAVAGATGYFTGNLPEAISSWAQDWMLWAAAALIVLLLVVVPWVRWLTHTYTITTRRVVEESGVLSRDRRQVAHARGYAITERRGPVQRMLGSGTLILASGADDPLRMVDVPWVRLVHEVLADQIEVGQILAHRDSHAMSVVTPGD